MGQRDIDGSISPPYFYHVYAEPRVMSKERWLEKLPNENAALRWGISVFVALAFAVFLEGWARKEAPVAVQPPGEVMGVVRLAAVIPAETRPPQERGITQAPPGESDSKLKMASDRSEHVIASKLKMPEVQEIPEKNADEEPSKPAPASQLEPWAPPNQDSENNIHPAPEPVNSVAVSRLVSPRQLDVGFRLVSGGNPHYPERARRASVAGEVYLELEIDPTGQVERLSISGKPTGWGFDEAVREAYIAARFTPPTVEGLPVRVRWLKKLRFSP